MGDRNKSMFDTQHRVKNKKKQFVEEVNRFGFVLMLIGLIFL